MLPFRVRRPSCSAAHVGTLTRGRHFWISSHEKPCVQEAGPLEIVDYSKHMLQVFHRQGPFTHTWRDALFNDPLECALGRMFLQRHRENRTLSQQGIKD